MSALSSLAGRRPRNTSSGDRAGAAERPRGILTGIAWQLLPWLVPGLIVLAYVLKADTHNLYFPSIGQIVSAGRVEWFGAGFGQNVAPSLENLFIGYFIGVAVGVALGLLLGLVKPVREMVWPIVSFLLTMPPVILLPILILLLGIGSIVQRSVIAFSVAIVTLVNTTDGVRSTDGTLGELSRVYRIRGARRIAFVVLPGAMTHILAAARVGLQIAMLLMVVGEMMGATHGIGQSIMLAQEDFAYAQMWSGVLLLALLGIILNALFVRLERLVLRSMGLSTGGGTS